MESNICSILFALSMGVLGKEIRMRWDNLALSKPGGNADARGRISVPLFEHGQGATVPSPKQKELTAPAQPCHSAMCSDGMAPACARKPPR